MNDSISKSQTIAWKKFGKDKSTSKPKRICLKCGTTHQITNHHVIPKVHLIFFKIKRLTAPTVSLCCKCHRDIEKHILFSEALLNRTRIGERLPLPKVDDYWYILSIFIGIQRFSELLKSGKVPRHPTINIEIEE